MDSRKKKVIAGLKENIQSLRETIEIVKRLPDDLPEEAIISAIAGCAFIEIPFDWNSFRAVRRELDASETTTWIPVGTFDSHDGSHTHCYHMEEDRRDRLHISMHPTTEGSKCKVVQVGTRELAIYKVICEEG